jgi:hypothetical protein
MTRVPFDDCATIAESKRNRDMEVTVGAIHVHEFMSLDGVIAAPTWTLDAEFFPEMEEAMSALLVPRHPARAKDL